MIDTVAAIDTPEHVRFQLRVAGPAVRAAAWVIDLALRVFVLAIFVSLAAVVAWALERPGLGTGVTLTLLFLSEWLWLAAAEIRGAGQSPGKWLMGLRVVRSDGSPAEWVDLVLRNLLRAADLLPAGYLLGGLASAIDPLRRRIGDWVAGTVVIYDTTSRLLGPLEFSPPITDEERAQLPVRVDLTRDECAAIEGLLRRSKALGPGRTEELALVLAPSIREASGIEAPTAKRVLTLALAVATGRVA